MTDLARQAFALGYAEEGVFPVPERAKAAALAVQESSIDDPRTARLIMEAGRTEAKRSKREKAHKRLYDFHSTDLAAALLPILKRLDIEQLSKDLALVAAYQADAGSDPVPRRRAVAGAALAAIAAQVHADDRRNLDTLNAAGWAHATAYGQAEAQATPEKGGPPDSAKVAAAAAVALKAISSSDAEAASQGWADLQLQSIAMGAALAAGDGASLGDAARKISAALVDTGRATQGYADLLHATVNQAFIAQMSQQPGALFNWETDVDPCDDCIDYSLESPYEANDLPACPAHPNCRCNVELASTSVPQETNA